MEVIHNITRQLLLPIKCLIPNMSPTNLHVENTTILCINHLIMFNKVNNKAIINLSCNSNNNSNNNYFINSSINYYFSSNSMLNYNSNNNSHIIILMEVELQEE